MGRGERASQVWFWISGGKREILGFGFWGVYMLIDGP